MDVSIFDTLTVTETFSAALYLSSPAKLTIIVAVPSPTALKSPKLSTVTIESSDEVKLKSPPSGFNVATI